MQDLARPGGNITGLTMISVQLVAKRLQLLMEAVPAVKRLGFLRPRGSDIEGSSAVHRALIAELALKARLPTMFPMPAYVEAGGLLSYGPNVLDFFRRAAVYVDKILKGAKPGDLPVEQPTRYELVINMKTAKALGLKIPQSILLRADRVIE